MPIQVTPPKPRKAYKRQANRLDKHLNRYELAQQRFLRQQIMLELDSLVV